MEIEQISGNLRKIVFMKKDKHWFESWAHLEPYLKKRPRGFRSDSDLFGQKLPNNAKCGPDCDNVIKGTIIFGFKKNLYLLT